jgi:hypothetical protein
MSITLAQTYSAIGYANTASFQGIGGSAPYTYSVEELGAGGTINASSGIYTAPSILNSSPNHAYDTILAVDQMGSVSTAQILIGTPLILFCDVIQKFMNLDMSHCYLWDQKIFQPTDSSLYVIISVESCKIIGNTLSYDSNGNSIQNVNMYNLLGLDIISRGPAARDQKELVIAALNSQYSEQQQEKNAFFIGRVSTNFVNLSHIDGAAIPYRFRISIGFQYKIQTILPIDYFSDFNNPPEVYTNA